MLPWERLAVAFSAVCLCRWIVAVCNVIALCLAKGLLFGRAAMSPETTIGTLPFLQAKNTALYLQLLWYPVAVRVVSLFFGVCFCWQLFIFVCLYVFLSHV